MTLRNRGELSGFSKVIVPFMGAAMRRAQPPGSRPAAIDPRVSVAARGRTDTHALKLGRRDSGDDASQWDAEFDVEPSRCDLAGCGDLLFRRLGESRESR